MTTTPPNRPTRRNIPFVIHYDGPIARITSLAGDPQTSDIITSMLNRYLHLIHRNPPKVSERELCAIIDALGITWAGEPHQVHAIPRDVLPIITTDRLDAKWSIDITQIRSRLERSSAADRTVLAEFCLAYWLATTEDAPPQVTLAAVRRLLQPSTSSAGLAPRPLRPDRSRHRHRRRRRDRVRH